MKYLICAQNVASVIILYYLYKNVATINSNIDIIKQEVTKVKENFTMDDDDEKNINETEKIPNLQTFINSNIDIIKHEVKENFTMDDDDEKYINETEKIPNLQTTSIEFNYTCCEPIFISTDLSSLLNIKKQICNFYELISILNNYLYEHDLLEFQHVKLINPLKNLINTEYESLPYHKFIEFVLDKHVQKYI
jgi:hypothetical protein